MLRSTRGRVLAPWILLLGLGGCSKPPPCAPVQLHERKHPFIAFDRQEIPALRQRVTQTPYKTWMDDVRRGPPGQGNPCGAPATNTDEKEYQSSNCALYGALSWVVEQRADALKAARDALMKAGDTSTGWNQRPGAWYWGGAMLNYAYAYDFVQPALSADDDEAIRDKLGDALGKTMGVYEDFDSAYTTNFRYRVGSGAATLSYALGERDDACTVERDLFGDAPLDSLVARGAYGPYVQACLTQDGTYVEGPSYQDDVFSTMLPYLQAMKRLSGGGHEGRDYINAVNTPAAWGDDTRIARMLRYGAALSMPDGNAATIETGWREPLQLASIAASVLSEREGRRDVKGFYGWLSAKGKAVVNNPVYSILYTDPDIAEASAGADVPNYTSVVTSDMTSLRSGWSADAVHLLMTTEHEYRPSSHSQPDQTSFLLHAKGQYLIIDPGDGRNYDPTGSPHTSLFYWVNFSPESHNLVTIDSYKGILDTYQTPAWRQLSIFSNLTQPVDDPAILQASFLTGELDSSTVTIDNYVNVPDVSTRRTAVLARRSYVVVFDHMISASSGSSAPMLHYYDTHLHYSGWLGCRQGAPAICTDYATSRPTSSSAAVDCGDVCGEVRPAGDPASGRLVWATRTDDGKRELELDVVYVPRPAAFSVDRSGFTNFFPNMTFRHPFSVARYVDSSTQWLTVLYPRDLTAGEPKPVIESLAVSGGSGSAALVSIAERDTQDLAVVSDGARPVEVGDPRVPAARLQGRSALLLLRRKALERAQVDASTSLSVGGRALLLATAPVSASLRPEGPGLAAELVLSSAAQVGLAAARADAQLYLDGKPAPTRYDAASGTASTSVPQGRHRLALR
ncbi:heparinase II/III domain-containing protein [Sorangium sp. So ce1000]|uniref:heparinase II/III domain-containing protein n=1 Tax=Sorangium sp. So ce1000 TaxID=3133325 RepID=UPI003F5D94E8